MKRATYTVESLCELIDGTIHPVNMSPEETKEFLESLQMEIESRLEALKEDILDKNNLNDFGGDL